jgi:hypothetical protein
MPDNLATGSNCREVIVKVIDDVWTRQYFCNGNIMSAACCLLTFIPHVLVALDYSASCTARLILQLLI